jgi:hypothetical protein
LQTEQCNGDLFILRLTENELIYYGNVLNEVLRGFRIDDFDSKLNASMETIKQLWNKFAWNRPENGEMVLSASEIVSLCRATRLCYEEFGDEEFATRLGVSAGEALKQVCDLEGLLADGTTHKEV